MRTFLSRLRRENRERAGEGKADSRRTEKKVGQTIHDEVSEEAKMVARRSAWCPFLSVRVGRWGDGGRRWQREKEKRKESRNRKGNLMRKRGYCHTGGRGVPRRKASRGSS